MLLVDDPVGVVVCCFCDIEDIREEELERECECEDEDEFRMVGGVGEVGVREFDANGEVTRGIVVEG